MKTNIILVKAFTQDAHQGNLAGIVFNADHLTDDQMKDIVQKTGASECVFVSKSKVAGTIKTLFFSPEKEMNNCAHAIIALGGVLKKNFRYETKNGIYSSKYNPSGLIEIKYPRSLKAAPLKTIDNGLIAPILRLNISDLLGTDSSIVNLGSKLTIELASFDSLMNAKPDFKAMSNACLEWGANGFYAYTFNNEKQATPNASPMIYARQWNPLTGVNEDPVTGIAAAGLADHLMDFGNTWNIQQGHTLNKIGNIQVTLDKKHVIISGFAVECGEIEFDF